MESAHRIIWQLDSGSLSFKMLRQNVAGILQNVLGDYFEPSCLSKEHVFIDLWGGKRCFRISRVILSRSRQVDTVGTEEIGFGLLGVADQADSRCDPQSGHYDLQGVDFWIPAAPSDRGRYLSHR